MSDNNKQLAKLISILNFTLNLKKSKSLTKDEETYKKLIQDTISFENLFKLSTANKANSLLMRYCLCTTIDEFCNPIFKHKNYKLLMTFHNNSFGGHIFFLVLKYFLKTPKQYQNELTNLYLLLKLGFQGELYDQKSKLRTVTQQLEEKISITNPKKHQKKFFYYRKKEVVATLLLMLTLLTTYILVNVKIYLLFKPFHNS